MTDRIDEVTSLTSIPITICNVPDPKFVEGDFVYNFYVENEDRQYSPEPTSPINYSLGLIDRDTIDSIEEKERGALRARVPRYNRIRIGVNTALGLETLDPNEISTDLRESLSRSKTYNREGNIENQYNAKVNISDDTVKERLQTEIYRITSGLFEGKGLTSEMSDEMIADSLNKMMSDDIDAASIMDALSDNSIKGIRFVNQITGKVFNRVDNKSSIQYPTKINADSYRTLTTQLMTSNPFSQYFESDILGNAADTAHVNPLLSSTSYPTFGSITTENLKKLKPIMGHISERDVTYYSRQSLASAGFPKIKHAGYIVEKIGLSPSGQYESFDDFISLNPQISEFIDPNIKYGYTYFYKARQLYIVDFLQIEDIESTIPERYVCKIVTAAIASSSPKTATVQAKDITPPRSPSTLICSFIYKAGNGIRLDWSPPINPTRDIKKYQVFRRASVMEPFQIIAEYDFTDEGYTQFEQREIIDSSLVRRTQVPQLSHVDPEFNRESSYIYSISAVDAHGLVSNYGTQVQASFDRIDNKLRTKVVSRAEAPRAYPNFYVDPTSLDEFGSDRLVEDVIKDEGHTRMRVYFDPDAYRVSSDEDGSETQAIVLGDRNGTYKFQIVNLDRQISKNLTISVIPDTSLSHLM